MSTPTNINFSAPLWEGFDRQELLLPTCTSCGKAHLPPGPFCPFCLGDALEWRKASGKARLTTWIVERNKVLPEFEPPYAVGQVEMDEGPRMVASLAMEDLPEFRSGAEGEVSFHKTSDGRSLPLFRLKAAL